MKSIPNNRQHHSLKKDPTRSITYRLPTKIVEKLEMAAKNNNVSQNVLVKQILEKTFTEKRV